MILAVRMLACTPFGGEACGSRKHLDGRAASRTRLPPRAHHVQSVIYFVLDLGPALVAKRDFFEPHLKIEQRKQRHGVPLRQLHELLILQLAITVSAFNSKASNIINENYQQGSQLRTG